MPSTYLPYKPAPITDATLALRLIHAQHEADAEAEAKNPPQKKYYKSVTTLRLLRPVTHATLVDLIRYHKKPPTRLRMTYLCRDKLWLEALTAYPNNYTEKNHPLMPTPDGFMGLPIVEMSFETVSRLSNPTPRAKRATGRGSRGAYKKTLAPDHDKRRQAKAYENMTRSKNTLYVKLLNPRLMTIEDIKEYMRIPMLRRRSPFHFVGMAEHCQKKLWGEAQAHQQTHGTLHPDMPMQSHFLGLPIRIVQPTDTWIA